MNISSIAKLALVLIASGLMVGCVESAPTRPTPGSSEQPEPTPSAEVAACTSPEVTILGEKKSKRPVITAAIMYDPKQSDDPDFLESVDEPEPPLADALRWDDHPEFDVDPAIRAAAESVLDFTVGHKAYGVDHLRKSIPLEQFTERVVLYTHMSPREASIRLRCSGGEGPFSGTATVLGSPITTFVDCATVGAAENDRLARRVQKKYCDLDG